MNLESKTTVSQFLALQRKSELELRAICEGMKIKPMGTSEDMIDQLLAAGVVEQQSILVAQAIPLRTRDNSLQPLPAAIEAMRNWRKLIFETKDNRKDFSLLNGKGKSYVVNLKYIKCTNETLKKILEEGWFLPVQENKDVIHLLKTNPDKFDTHIVQKPDGSGNSWLMLHVELKKAA